MRLILSLRLLLLTIGAAVGLLAAEALLRLVDWRAAPAEESIGLRYYWSRPYLRVDSEGAVRGVPELSVREAAVAAEQVVFDVRLATNRQGLIDTEDYNRDGARCRAALAGDSYTAGTSAVPWFPGLRARFENNNPDFKLYNLGLVGTGVQHFEKLVLSLQAELDFTHVVFLVIGADFDRFFWVPRSGPQGIWFCAAGGQDCQLGRPHVGLIDAAASQAELLEGWHSERQLLQADPQPSAPSPMRKGRLQTLIGRSKLLSLLNAGRHRIGGQLRSRFANNLPPRFSENFAAFRRVVRRFGAKHVLVLHFPSKIDVVRGWYEVKIAAKVKELGVRYVSLWDRCEFSLGKYRRFDHHFNEAGYADFSACVEQALQEYLAGECRE